MAASFSKARGFWFPGKDSLATRHATWHIGIVQTKTLLRQLAGLWLVLAAAGALEASETGIRLRYLVLSTTTEVAPPFAEVDIIYGARDSIRLPGSKAPEAAQWWQFEIRATTNQAAPPLCIVRGLSSGNNVFTRYQLQIPATGESFEYVDARSGKALLPAWVDFEKHFVPRPAAATLRRDELPETGELLGQVLSLAEIRRDEPWAPWPKVKLLKLDREVWVGTARNFKDTEGKRLAQTPQPTEYTYTNFTAADYRVMIDAGMNLFTVAPEQQQYVQAEPVFYLRSATGTPALDYPADLYRANYLGAAMFVDEPASVLQWDKYVGDALRYFSDASTLIEKRTRVTFDSTRQHYGRYWLESQFAGRGVNFGDMRLGQLELPVWETEYECAFYELKGGGSGIVHEGRYKAKEFDDAFAKITGQPRAHTPREVLSWYYAFLRGAARPFDKFWGTSIYGQCDAALAPEALSLAYDMGARYFWFWTSDHGHHLPWREQLELTQTLRKYAREHARPSIFEPHLKVDTAIAIPDGYFVTLADLSWIHGMDGEGKNEQSQTYQRLLRRTVEAVEKCYREQREFDITIDDGRPIKGYKRVVKINAAP